LLFQIIFLGELLSSFASTDYHRFYETRTIQINILVEPAIGEDVEVAKILEIVA